MHADPRLVALVDRVRGFAGEQGREDLARALEWRLEVLADAGPLTLVIAGKTNSGKSTLVNGLFGREVVAAGADTPTLAPTVIEYDTDLRVVDTPGTDSAGAAERAHAVEQVLSADALVFVSDPLVPLSRPELRFLQEAATALADVIFVLGKADLVLDVEAAVAAHRLVLERIAPRWAAAPVFALSALEKTEADAAGDADLALMSGVPALGAHVVGRLVPHAAVVRSAAVVQACRSTLRELEIADRAALDGDDRAAALAEAAVADHRAYVEATAPQWTADFAREYQRRTRQIIERDLRLRLLERREQRDIRIKSGAVALEEVTAQVKGDLSDVTVWTQQALVEQVAALVSEWTARLELEAVHLPALSGMEVADVVMPSLDIGKVNWQGREKAQGFAGLVNLARSAASGRSLAGLLPGGLVMGTGVGIVMTGLSWGTSEWLRHKIQDQQGALSFVQAAFARAQIELEAALREQALELQPVAQTTLQRSIDARREELALDAARLQQQAEQAAIDRERARAVAARRLEELGPFARSLDELGDRFTTFLRAGTVPALPATTTPGT
jgi:GTP-binding protein